MGLPQKIARRWLLQKIALFSPEFYRMVGVRRFRHPETGNMVLFYSLPSEEQKRIHDAWAAKRSEHKVRLTRPEMRQLRKDMRQQQREQDAEEAKAGQADRAEMAKKLKELKSKNLPKRIFEKEKRRLVQEIEMRAMKREQQRKEEAAKPPTVKIEE